MRNLLQRTCLIRREREYVKCRVYRVVVGQLIVLSLITLQEADVDMIVYDSTDRDEEEENCCEESTEEDEESPAEDLPDQEGERVCRVEYIE